MWLGIFPTVDVHRKKIKGVKRFLCGGKRFVMWISKQDIDHLQKAFGLRHFGSDWPCELCECNRIDGDWPNNFHNFASDANWKNTVHTRRSWRLGQTLHPLFQLPHFGCENIEPDELHIMHLGTTMYLLASVLWMLVYKLMRGTPTANMHLVWVMVTQRYSDLSTECQFSNLSLSSFCDPEKHSSKYPKLKGRGAEVKDLVAPLLFVWDHFMNKRDKMHCKVRDLLTYQLDIQSILADNAPYPFLPVGAAKNLKQLIDLYLEAYSILAQDADDKEELLWPVVPKHHWLWHLGDRCLYLNPRRGCTLVDEDFVGRMKVIVAACVHGTKAHNVPEAVVLKYIWGLHFLNTYGL